MNNPAMREKRDGVYELQREASGHHSIPARKQKWQIGGEELVKQHLALRHCKHVGMLERNSSSNPRMLLKNANHQVTAPAVISDTNDHHDTPPNIRGEHDSDCDGESPRYGAGRGRWANGSTGDARSRC